MNREQNKQAKSFKMSLGAYIAVKELADERGYKLQAIIERALRIGLSEIQAEPFTTANI